MTGRPGRSRKIKKETTADASKGQASAGWKLISETLLVALLFRVFWILQEVRCMNFRFSMTSLLSNSQNHLITCYHVVYILSNSSSIVPGPVSNHFDLLIPCLLKTHINQQIFIHLTLKHKPKHWFVVDFRRSLNSTVIEE